MVSLIGTKLHMQTHKYVYDCPTMTVHYVYLSTRCHWSNKNVKLLLFIVYYLSF